MSLNETDKSSGAAQPRATAPGPDAGPDASNSLKAPGIQIGLRLLRTGPAVILVALVVIMAFLNEYFLTVRNLQNLLTQTTMIATLALGQLLVIVVRGVDVSVGSVLGLTVVLSGLMMSSGIENGLVHAVVFITAGALFGLFNGFMIVKGGIPQPLIVTVATLGIGRGMALLLSGGTERIGMPPVVQAAGSGSLFGIPVPAIIVAMVALLLAALTRKTLWGRWIYAVGGNPDVAGWLGVPRDRVIMSCYMLSGVTAGIAGMIYAGRTDAASPLAGVGMELDAVTAVIIGGASLFGGRGHIVNALIGALIIGVIRNGLNLMSVSPFWEAIAIGAAILFALELDVLRRYLEEKLRARAARAMR